MTDCPNAMVRDRLPDLLHGALDAPTRAAVEAHLLGCADCARELALLRAARATLARAPEVDVARIVAALPRRATTQPRLVQFPSPAERARRHGGARVVRWGGLAAAAAVVLALGLGSLAVDDRATGRPGAGATDGATAPVLADAGPADRPTDAAAARPTAAARSAGEMPLLVVNTAGLSDADLAGLLDELDDLEAVPAADPLSLVPVAELPTAGGSGAGP